MEGLHRVDHAHVGTLRLERGAHGLEVSLGEDLDARGAAEPLGAKLDLGDRFLAGDEQRAALLRHLRERGEQERRLADAGLTPDQHE